MSTNQKILDSFKLKIDASKTLLNAPNAKLIEDAVKDFDAQLTHAGALVVKTGKHTGRAAKDKYVVLDAKTKESIDWESDIHKLEANKFTELRDELINHLDSANKVYLSTANVGSIEDLSISAMLASTHPSHSIFFSHMMRQDGFDMDKGFGTYKIYHAPNYKFDAKKHGLRSETAIAMNLSTNEILIGGTLYAGEIKKSLFSVLNYILPEQKILPMHAGSNISSDGDVSVFFGLSGTGKTTLSTQEGRKLIGDDEHGLSDSGIFNFEGGCYAKTYKLSKKGEPGIFAASNKFATLLENVVLDEKNIPDFNDKSLAENTRSAYPLSYIEGVEESSKGGIPSNMFFLTADAFGVLPPVSRLNADQAKYYFLSGYTAKLAGTEIGVTEPQATFSTCFGAPFMMRFAQEYADLLGHYIAKYDMKVWLINTGWTGGAYGVGERFPLKVTRRIIDAIQTKELNTAQFEKEEMFGLEVPKEIKDVDAKLLNPRLTWSDSDAFKATAQKLSQMFDQNFSNFKNIDQSIINAGPKAQ